MRGRRNGSTRRWRALRARWQRVILNGYVVCRRCGEQIHPTDDWHLGHIVPVLQGGTDTADNVSPEHARCNLRGKAADRHGVDEVDHPPTFPW